MSFIKKKLYYPTVFFRESNEWNIKYGAIK